MSKKLCEMKTNKWCITYWLTDGRTVEDLELITQQMPANWSLEGQIEQGVDSQQKLHAQLFLKTEQTRGTKIAKYFKNCYINEAKNPFALQNYVHKEDTRVAELKTVENRSPQWSVVCDKFFDWVVENDLQGTSFMSSESPFDQRLRTWDDFIGQSIREGMRVEVIGVNPQYRACVSRYWDSFVYQAARRQIDRQTNSLPQVSPGGGVCQMFNFPENSSR